MIFFRFIANSLAFAAILASALLGTVFAIETYPQPWPWIYGALFGLGVIRAAMLIFRDIDVAIKEYVHDQR